MKMRINLRKQTKKILDYLKDVKAEVRKVDWLNLKETMRYTLVVIFASVVIAAFLAGTDFLLTRILNKFVLR